MNSTLNSLQSTPLPSAGVKNLVFIDSAVDNFSTLLKGLKPNSEAVILDPTQDGIAQITQFMANYSGAIASIQILSHGAAGSLQLGSSRLTSDNLDQYKTALQQWFPAGNTSTNRPDLLLYGCDVGAGAVGSEFINKLGAITGADVAASVDLTGNAAKGGNWILEKATGAIEVGQAFTKKVRDAYQDVLATFTVTNANDSGAGSLSQAIKDANNTPNIGGIPDNIFFDPSIKLIQPLTPLPPITDSVNLDGRTNQTGTAPGVAIDGIKLPVNADTHGIYINNDQAAIFGNGSIRGLAIGNFGGSGLRIDRSDNNLIEYNYIGTDITGTVAKGNSRSMIPRTSHGLLIWASQNNTIRNNVVSANNQSGIVLFGTYQTYGYYSGFNLSLSRNSSGNQILNNKVGTDVTGNYALGNLRYGIFIDGANNLVDGNVASANGYYPVTGESFPNIGVEYGHANTIFNNTISNNTVGLNASRTAALPAGASDAEIRMGFDGTVADQGNRATGNFYSYNDKYTDTDRLGAKPNKAQDFPTGSNTSIPFKLTNIASATLTPKAPQLSTLNSGQPVNNGDSIDTLVGSSVGGTPGRGIAVTKVDDTNGTWQYSTDNGSSWSGLGAAVNTPLPRGENFYTGTPDGVFMLAADNKNRVRFVPNAGFTGTIANGVTYMAWNQLAGGNGMWQNINSAGREYPYTYFPDYGFTTFKATFSSPAVYRDSNTGQLTNGRTDSFGIKVINTNAAPVLDPSLIQPLTPIAKDQAINLGTLVTALIPGLAITDPDVGASKGIAVTGVDNSNGAWQYALDGTTWVAFGSPSQTNARLLAADATTKIRFVPNLGYEGAPKISFEAWDQTAGLPGATGDASITGGIAPFSLVTGQGAIAVGNATVPPPVVTPSAPLSAPPDLGILRLLQNPPAPATPAPVIVGEDPRGQYLDLEGKPPVGIQDPVGKAPTGLAEDPDCACEVVIKQQKSNPVTGVIQGTNKKDYLVGTATANTIYGSQGKDTIIGTPNRDNLYGGKGNDLIRGLGQRDYIRGGAGNDTIYGGKGSDVIFGDKGKDTIYGGRGNDFISGGKGKDTLYGGKGNDFISGGKGSDRLYGGDGNDNLCGCEGNDILRGGKGKDTLNGGKGNDLLVGGKGKDTLTGGAGRDRFRLAPNSGTDTITDFSVGEDFIELARGLKFSDLQITQGVGATVLSLQPGTLFPTDKPLALLLGITATSLTPNSFTTV